MDPEGETLYADQGLLQTFRGSGTVWIAPTQPLYERMKNALPGASPKA